MSNIKNEISVITGILSVIVCLILGLVGNLRITTVLFRTLVCFAITVILCLFVVTAVEKFSQGHKSTLVPPSNGRTESQRQNVDKPNNSKQGDETTSKAL
ncbi:MAG: hypothetical protein QG641_2843 [Candidatus Poribacteria bacterium]|nr:hypothetical protein [Candidatus Poribacteria bacterium]MDQ1329552.1 hypothetical protein [Candidatus Poribacteria bacterium]